MEHNYNAIQLDTAKELLHKKYAYIAQVTYDLLQAHKQDFKFIISTKGGTPRVYISHCFKTDFPNSAQQFKIERLIILQLAKDCASHAVVSLYKLRATDNYPDLDSERVLYRDYAVPSEKKLVE